MTFGKSFYLFCPAVCPFVLSASSSRFNTQNQVILFYRTAEPTELPVRCHEFAVLCSPASRLFVPSVETSCSVCFQVRGQAIRLLRRRSQRLQNLPHLPACGRVQCQHVLHTIQVYRRPLLRLIQAVISTLTQNIVRHSWPQKACNTNSDG